MSLFLHQTWRNVAFHQCLSNGCSAVNGCRQNGSPNGPKKCSGLNQEINLHRSSSVYKTKQLETNMWVDFDVMDNRRCTFSLEEALLWIMDSYFSLKTS